MRPAFESTEGPGIWTGFPSATRFRLALGADLPWADCLYPGNLMFSADGNPTRLCVTYTCILTSRASSRPRGPPSPAWGMLPYRPALRRRARSFGMPLSPVTLSAHTYSTSELLRTLSRNGCF